jgi:predicted transposase/invertase (TIGR01784 family)
MILGVDPKVDYAFKHLFGREVNRSILIDVLNAVLEPPAGERILGLELLNPFNPKESLDDKLSILDIKARDQTGRQFNVEMQILAFPAYDKRILYYASKLHQQQLYEGQDYVELRPTISVSFLNHVLFPEIEDHHLRFRLLENTHHLALGEDLAFHILELPKFKKAVDKLQSNLDIWLYFLRHAEKMDSEALPAALEKPLVRRALEELKMLTQADLERERYEARRKAQLDHNSFVNAARREGLKQGLEEGRQEGRIEVQRQEKIGLIHFCERLLNRPQTPADQLTRVPLDDLIKLAEKLQAEVMSEANSRP